MPDVSTIADKFHFGKNSEQTTVTTIIIAYCKTAETWWLNGAKELKEKSVCEPGTPATSC